MESKHIYEKKVHLNTKQETKNYVNQEKPTPACILTFSSEKYHI